MDPAGLEHRRRGGDRPADPEPLRRSSRSVVGRSGWAQGNALALQFSGTGRRTAEAFESGAATAPRLHVEFTTGSSGPVSP